LVNLPNRCCFLAGDYRVNFYCQSPITNHPKVSKWKANVSVIRSHAHGIRKHLLSVKIPGLMLLALIITLVLASGPVNAQLSPLVPTNGHSVPAGVEQQGTLESAPVKLDGKTLFRIASPAVINRSDPGYQVPVEVRASQIEGNLQRLLPDPRSSETPIAPEQLSIAVKIVNGFPVLFAESPALPQPRALLTVTDKDAQYYAVGRDELAEQWRDELEQKLRQALDLRQPEAIRQRLHIFFKVLIGTALVTLGLGFTWVALGRREKFLRQQRELQLTAQQDEAEQRADATTLQPPTSYDLTAFYGCNGDCNLFAFCDGSIFGSLLFPGLSVQLMRFGYFRKLANWRASW
jgi:hypothetical protein